MVLHQCLIGALLVMCGVSGSACAQAPAPDVSPSQVEQFFAQRGKLVLTFVGYSGSGYEDVEKMLDEAK